MLLNKVLLIGRLTREPERRYSPSGTVVADVGFAIAGLKKDETSFVDLVFFNKQADKVCETCQKGDELLVEGRLKQERWEAQDSTRRSCHKVIVGMFSRSFKDKSKGQEAAPPVAQPAEVQPPEPATTQGLPF